jgi:hypothetical protein
MFAMILCANQPAGGQMSMIKYQYLQVANHCDGLLRLLTGLLFIVVLAGCTSSSPTVIDAKRVFQPSIRVAIDLKNGEKAASEPKTGHAIEFGYVQAKGGSDQTLAAGQPPVIFNQTVFNAPQQIRNDFDMNFTDVSWRWRKFFRERSLGLELTGGLGYSSLGLTVSSPTQSASEHFGGYGPQGGVAFIWRMRPGSSLHVRVSGFKSEKLRFSREELFFTQALGENLSLRAGYAQWKVNDSVSVFENHSLQMDFSGPMLGLDLSF